MAQRQLRVSRNKVDGRMKHKRKQIERLVHCMFSVISWTSSLTNPMAIFTKHLEKSVFPQLN